MCCVGVCFVELGFISVIYISYKRNRVALFSGGVRFNPVTPAHNLNLIR